MFNNYSSTSKCVDDIALGLEKGHYPLAIFLDIKKVYDTIDHKIIIDKRRHAGVGVKMLTVIRNYLYNRKKCVLYNADESNIRSLSTGVP